MQLLFIFYFSTSFRISLFLPVLCFRIAKYLPFTNLLSVKALTIPVPLKTKSFPYDLPDVMYPMMENGDYICNLKTIGLWKPKNCYKLIMSSECYLQSNGKKIRCKKLFLCKRYNKLFPREINKNSLLSECGAVSNNLEPLNMIESRAKRCHH